MKPINEIHKLKDGKVYGQYKKDTSNKILEKLVTALLQADKSGMDKDDWTHIAIYRLLPALDENGLFLSLKEEQTINYASPPPCDWCDEDAIQIKWPADDDPVTLPSPRCGKCYGQ